MEASDYLSPKDISENMQAMTPEEHIEEACRLFASSTPEADEPKVTASVIAVLLDGAQLHASLATAKLLRDRP
jgi:hypothetical protein